MLKGAASISLGVLISVLINKKKQKIKDNKNNIEKQFINFDANNESEDQISKSKLQRFNSKISNKYNKK